MFGFWAAPCLGIRRFFNNFIPTPTPRGENKKIFLTKKGNLGKCATSLLPDAWSGGQPCGHTHDQINDLRVHRPPWDGPPNRLRLGTARIMDSLAKRARRGQRHMEEVLLAVWERRISVRGN